MSRTRNTMAAMLTHHRRADPQPPSQRPRWRTCRRATPWRASSTSPARCWTANSLHRGVQDTEVVFETMSPRGDRKGGLGGVLDQAHSPGHQGGRVRLGVLGGGPLRRSPRAAGACSTWSRPRLTSGPRSGPAWRCLRRGDSAPHGTIRLPDLPTGEWQANRHPGRTPTGAAVDGRSTTMSHRRFSRRRRPCYRRTRHPARPCSPRWCGYHHAHG